MTRPYNGALKAHNAAKINNLDHTCRIPTRQMNACFRPTADIREISFFIKIKTYWFLSFIFIFYFRDNIKWVTRCCRQYFL